MCDVIFGLKNAIGVDSGEPGEARDRIDAANPHQMKFPKTTIQVVVLPQLGPHRYLVQPALMQVVKHTRPQCRGFLPVINEQQLLLVVKLHWLILVFGYSFLGWENTRFLLLGSR